MASQNGNGKNWPMAIVAGALTIVLGAIGVRFWQLPNEITSISAEIKIISAKIDGVGDNAKENRLRIIELERSRVIPGASR